MVRVCGHADRPTGASVGDSLMSSVASAWDVAVAERDGYSVEGFGDVGRLAPGPVDAQVEPAGAVGESGNDVQHPVAERGNLAAGQFGDVGEANLFGSTDQVDRGHDGLHHARFALQALHGRSRRPVALASRMRFATGSCCRCRNSSSAIPRSSPVPVRNPDAPCPSSPVKVSWAPGWGRSLRRISRVPAASSTGSQIFRWSPRPTPRHEPAVGLGRRLPSTGQVVDDVPDPRIVGVP